MKQLLDPATGTTVRMFSRSECGLPPSKARKKPWARRHVIIHHGVGRGNKASTAEAVQIWRAYWRWHHKSLGWSDIGYSWGVTATGVILEGRGWQVDGSHTQRGGNRVGHAICFIGDGRWSRGTPEQWAAVRALIAEGIRVGAVTPQPKLKITGHQDWWPKECPGALIQAAMKVETAYFQRPPTKPSASQQSKEDPVVPGDILKFVQAEGHPVYLADITQMTIEGIETSAARAGLAELFDIDPTVHQVHKDVIDQFRVTTGGR